MPLLPPSRRPRQFLSAALVLLGVTGAAFAGPAVTRSAGGLSGGPNGGPNGGMGAGPVRCELDISRKGSSVELTALAHADKGVRGDYTLHITGRGTDIRQGGPFAAGSGRAEQLGTVTLGAGGGGYDVDLKLTVAGKTIDCSDRVGGFS